jgi:hypothetical protein
MIELARPNLRICQRCWRRASTLKVGDVCAVNEQMQSP